MQDFGISADPKRNLILCDVEGTLVIAGQGPYNEKLFKFLKAAQDNDYEVVIFSADPTGSKLALRGAELRLRAEGVLAEGESFGEVFRKDLYDGKRAFIVIDDDHSTHKVDCENQFLPDDPRIDKMLAYHRKGQAMTNSLPRRDDPKPH